MEPEEASGAKGARLTPYQRKLFLFLSVATFFEGYDFFALAQVLPEIQEDFGLSRFEVTALSAFINAGTIAAYFLVRRADRWGRRPVLMATILGYAGFTFLSGISWSITSFAVFQFFARIFLIAEWATAMVYAAEEFPAARRGMVIGVLQAFSSLGAVLCAGVVPMLVETSFGWRSVYLVGVAPLLILAYARRNLRETARFQEKGQGQALERPLLAILRTPHRSRVLWLGLIWFLTYACTQNAVHFWKLFAADERGFTDVQVAQVLTFSALAAMPLVFAAGKLLDRIGRRRGAIIIFTATSVGVLISYTAEDQSTLTLGLTLAVFGVSAVLTVLNAFTAELFPTEWRGDAFAWSNNLLGRISYVLSPLLIGVWAERTQSWGAAIRPTAVLPLLALVVILVALPETNQRELEESSAL